LKSDRKQLLPVVQHRPSLKDHADVDPHEYNNTMGGSSSDLKVGMWRREATPKKDKEKLYASIIQDTPSNEGNTNRGIEPIQVEPLEESPYQKFQIVNH
jgi:hypothetical protein